MARSKTLKDCLEVGGVKDKYFVDATGNRVYLVVGFDDIHSATSFLGVRYERDPGYIHNIPLAFHYNDLKATANQIRNFKIDENNREKKSYSRLNTGSAPIITE